MSSILKSKKTKWTTFLTAAFLVACLAPSGAEARKRKKRRKKAPIAAKYNVRALGELMGTFKFGMSKDKVVRMLGSQLTERYKAKIKETSDVYEQDALRREKSAEIKKIRSSFTEFEGAKTGWDVSIIDDQFAHKTDESMLVYWEHNSNGNDQRRFFFFNGGRLYKMFIVMDSKSLPAGQRNFDFFKTLMVKRYGNGKLITKKKRSGATIPLLMDWATPTLHVQAIDKLSFYGSFCLMISDPKVESELAVARDSVRSVRKSNSVINSMLENDDNALPSLDSNSSAIDSALK